MCFALFLVRTSVLAAGAGGLETVNLALPARSMQMILYPLAQEKGYMQEEGIDLKPILVKAELGVQAMVGGSLQFSMAGTSVLVSITKGAPLKVILETNDQVLQWIAGSSRPQRSQGKPNRQ